MVDRSEVATPSEAPTVGTTEEGSVPPVDREEEDLVAGVGVGDTEVASAAAIPLEEFTEEIMLVYPNIIYFRTNLIHFLRNSDAIIS